MRRRAFFLVGLLAALASTLAGCGGDDGSPADIAFVSSRDGEYAVFVMAANGDGERRLTDSDGAEESDSPFFQIDPAWSPDAVRIAFVSGRSGSSDVYVMNADGSETAQLTSTKQNDTHPTWSADGSTIAFARDGDIYTMSDTGSNVRRISDVLVEESDPAWSPDGEWIAYVRRTPGTPVQNVWVMRTDGSDRRALTRQDGRAFTPAWSPDSSRIVFSTNAEGEVYELYTVGLDGKGLRRVVPTAGDNLEPSWSPDGTKISYQEEGAIYTVTLGGDGDDVERLTDSANNDSSPAWKPVPSGE